jgi:hypothetical protein
MNKMKKIQNKWKGGANPAVHKWIPACAGMTENGGMK